MKVADLAKELGYSAKELVVWAKAKGIKIQSSRDSLDEKMISLIRTAIPRTSATKPTATKEVKKEGTARATAKEEKAKHPHKVVAKKEKSKPEAKPSKTHVRPAKKLPVVKKKKSAPAPAEFTAEEKKEAAAPLLDVDKILGAEKEVKVLRPSAVEKLLEKAVPEVEKEKRTAKPTGKPPLKHKPAKPIRAEEKSRGVPVTVVGKPVAPVTPVEKKIEVAPPISVKDLSQLLGVKVTALLRKLIDHNILVTINSSLDEDAVTLLALEFNKKLEIKKQKPLEETLILQEPPDRPEDLAPRAPVVVFMGHVDHGKTSLLDRIRQTKVAAQEAGGITQHIGAYKVSVGNGKHVVFLDTPGHEAFTAMRARGAQVTDVAVLVVAADDGVMPQTEEAIAHAQAAGVPIIIAVNKCDKKEANPNRVKHQLSQLNLIPEEWGGKTVFVEVSALTGHNVEHLLEMLALEAELLELKANPKKAARGTVLEAKKTEGRGIVAHVLVQNGVLRRGDILVCGKAYGRVRALVDSRGHTINEAPPATPIEVLGLTEVPEAGDKFMAVSNLETAKQIAETRATHAKEQERMARQHVTLENLFTHIESGQMREVRVIIKTDVKGSVEVLAQSFKNITAKATPSAQKEVHMRVLHSGVGSINESDVLLADASDAIIVGFNVIAEERARTMAKEKGVEIRTYDVIYKAVEDMKAALEGLLEPEKVEQVVGHVSVKEIFKVSRIGTVAGCLVTDGKIERSNSVRISRNGRVVHTGKIESLKRFKDDVREVASGFECGIKLANYNDIQTGDIIEAFTIQEVARKLT